MDGAMLDALLKSYGAANTAENANKIREFYAANPDQAERRAMGMRGSGYDDRSDLLQLDKYIESTMQPGKVTSEPLPPIATGNSAPSPQQAVKTGGAAAAPSGGKMFGPPNDPSAAKRPLQESPVDMSAPNQGFVGGKYGEPDVGKEASSDVDPFWPLLIGSIVGGGVLSRLFTGNRTASTATPGQPALPGPEPMKQLTYEPKLTDQRSPAQITDQRTNKETYDYGAPKIEKGALQKVGAAMQDPNEIARMRAEVDAENAQLMEQMKVRAAQENTRKTIAAARRATGRRY